MKTLYFCVFGIGLLISACSKQQTASEQTEQLEISKEQSEKVKEQLAEPSVEIAETSISVAEDFEEETQKTITEENYKKTLSAL
ncbi:MAG: hypothetical protein IPJ88_14195 [Myxococcales bacterium]|nr:MAG: hypothetical protein IPJ88_14195 [Myxococcales bacterium]